MRPEILVLLACGVLAVVAVYACLRVAGDADRREEKLQQERERNKDRDSRSK